MLNAPELSDSDKNLLAIPIMLIICGVGIVVMRALYIATFNPKPEVASGADVNAEVAPEEGVHIKMADAPATATDPALLWITTSLGKATKGTTHVCSKDCITQELNVSYTEDKNNRGIVAV